MRKIALTAAVILSLTQVQAQFSYDYLKAADDYFRKGDFYSAAQYYEKFLNTGGKTREQVYRPYTIQSKSKKATVPVSNKEQAVYNTAEAYRLLNYYVKAEPFYQQSIQAGKDKFPLASYWHAVTLRALARYEEAEKAFAGFLNDYTTSDDYSEAARREIANLQFIQKELRKKDLKYYSVQPAGSSDTGAYYAPVWMDENTVLITSTRPEAGSGKNNEYTNRVYRASYTSGSMSGMEKLPLPQPKDVHQGVVTMTPDGNTIFLTRWMMEGAKKTSAIYSSTKSDGKWSEPSMLGAGINEAGFSAQQPYVMPGGKHLIYASDKPGGQGGFDLWMAELDATGKPSNSVNLGAAINTKWDEQAPYYHGASKSLVFSSNGRVGMGGLDFFYAKGEPGNWQEPVNFGYPVNSVKDDIYFASRGTEKNILADVLLSSDRAAACCLQLFSVKRVIPVKQVSGVVVACDSRTPINGAVVTVVDTITNQTVFTKTTDASGTYALTLDAFRPLKVMAATEGYHPGALSFAAPADEEANALSNPELCLSRIIVEGTKEVLDNVYFEFNKATVLEESHASLDKLVRLMNDNPNAVVEIGGHTDDKGGDAYNQRLSEARAQAVVEYLVSQGIDRSRLMAKGYGKSQPIAPNKSANGSDNPAGRDKNRRTEFKVLKNDNQQN
jgi:outer membrane protein OmpA-like peptidoglycan-associated protein/tetratricopeptide (TPR) repeat protein